MQQTDLRTALVIFTREGPALQGGGRGVTYQFLLGMADDFPRLDGADLYCLFDEYLVPLKSAEDARSAITFSRRSRFHDLPKWLGRPPKIVLQAQIVRRLAAKYQRTVVLAYTHFHAGNLLGNDARISIIHTEHSKGGMHTEHLALRRHKDLQYRLLKTLCDKAIKRADSIVFPSRSASELYASHNPHIDFLDKSVIVYNGVQDPCNGGPLSVPEPEANKAITIFNIAQHVPEKGLDLLLRGLGLWKQRTSFKRPLRLLNCGGATAETPKLIELARTLKIESMCEFAGWKERSQVLAHLESAEVFALTPTVAVFDLALLEAMALARPVLSTPVGGNLEALGEHYAGYVKTPEQIAEKLDMILTDPGFALALSTGNRSRFLEHFQLRSMVAGYVSLLRQFSGENVSVRTAAAR